MTVHDTCTSVPAADGVPLAATWFARADLAADAPLVLVCSATAVTRAFYASFARFLAGRGLAVLTFDYRGIGESLRGPLRANQARMRDWGERDLTGITAWAEREHARRPLLLVGHSVGGQLLGLSSRAGQIAAAVFVAAQSGYFGHWPVPRRQAYAVLWWLLVPLTVRLLGYFPSRRMGFGGEDLPSGVAREWARWCRTPHYMSDDAGAPLRPHFDAVHAPIRAYSFSDDPYATARSVDALLAFYVNAPTSHAHLRPEQTGAAAIGHFGFFREGRCPPLWSETAEWLEHGARAAA